jgi:hypothetical protein
MISFPGTNSVWTYEKFLAMAQLLPPIPRLDTSNYIQVQIEIFSQRLTGKPSFLSYGEEMELGISNSNPITGNYDSTFVDLKRFPNLCLA